MSSAAIPLPPDPSPEPVFRLSVRQYHAMIDAGVLTDDDPVELLEGILVFKMPKKPGHRIALAKLQRILPPLLPTTMALQVQEPITLSDGEPEPDAAVIDGRPEDYADRHPGVSDVRLVVEVADTTLARDRGIKLRGYARAGLPVYWIVNLVERTLEVYTEPDGDASPPAYRQTRVFRPGDSAPLELSAQAVGTVAVGELMP
jgi:Uma2 family endonuclease